MIKMYLVLFFIFIPMTLFAVEDQISIVTDAAANKTGITGQKIEVSSSSFFLVQSSGVGTGFVHLGNIGCGGNYAGIHVNGALGTGCDDFNLASSPTDNSLYINRPAGGSLRFREAGGSDQMIIRDGGTIGISTITPVSLFALNNGTVTISAGNFFVSSSTFGYILRSSNNSCWQIQVSNTGALSARSKICP